MTYLIDTAQAIEHIADSGLPREQATAIVQTFAEAGDEVATKSDIQNLQEKIDKCATKDQLNSLKNYLMYRIVVIQLAGVGLVFTLIKFFGA